MNFSESQIAWLKKATARDISKVFAKKDLDFNEKMNIHKKWLEVHQEQRNSVLNKAADPNWWLEEE